jgi:hypothetical protein
LLLVQKAHEEEVVLASCASRRYNVRVVARCYQDARIEEREADLVAGAVDDCVDLDR